MLRLWIGLCSFFILTGSLEASVVPSRESREDIENAPDSLGLDSYAWVPGIDLEGLKLMIQSRPDTSKDIRMLECPEAALMPTREIETCNPWDAILVFSEQVSPLDFELLPDWQPVFKTGDLSSSVLADRFALVSFGGERYFQIRVSVDFTKCREASCFVELSIPQSDFRLCSSYLRFKKLFCGGTLNVGNGIFQPESQPSGANTTTSNQSQSSKLIGGCLVSGHKEDRGSALGALLLACVLFVSLRRMKRDERSN